MNFVVEFLVRLRKIRPTRKDIFTGLRWAAINTFFAWAFLHTAYLDTNWYAWAAVAFMDAALFFYSVYYLSPWEAELNARHATEMNLLRKDLESFAAELGTNVTSSFENPFKSLGFTRDGVVFAGESQSTSIEGRATGCWCVVEFTLAAPAPHQFYIRRKRRFYWRRWFSPKICEDLSSEFDFFGSNEDFLKRIFADDRVMAKLMSHIKNEFNPIRVDFNGKKFKIKCPTKSVDTTRRAEDLKNTIRTAIVFCEAIKNAGK